MKQLTLLVASVYATTSVILGAFGAHAFKRILSLERLHSFEVGVRYQMYGALILLFLGVFFKFDKPIQQWVSLLMIVGVFMFSTSIYILSFRVFFGVDLRFLAPITPIGGAIMISSLLLLVYVFAKKLY